MVLLFDVVIYETLKIKKHLTIKVKCFVNKYYIVYKESFFKGKTKEKSPDAAVTDGHCEGENMTEKEMQEHLYKELLKKIVDNGKNYTEKMKSDLKGIIDLGKSPEEICEATLAYFAMCRWQ